MSSEQSYQHLNTNYQITDDVLEAEVKVASPLKLVPVAVFSILLTVLIGVYFLNSRYGDVLEFTQTVIIAVAIANGVFILSVLGGLVWQWFGTKVSTTTYEMYLDEERSRLTKLVSKLYFRFVEQDHQIYFEARARDPEFTGLINRIRLIFRMTITELSFFILALTFLSRPLVAYVRELFPTFRFLDQFQVEIILVLSIGFSVYLMAFYFPAVYITRDANIRTWRPKDLKVGVPLATLRDRVDNVIGIGALITGWSLYSNLYAPGFFIFVGDFLFLSSEGVFLRVLDYILWLGAIILLFYVLSIPAVITYFYRHERVINRYRSRGIRRGVPVGVSNVRPPQDEEIGRVEHYLSDHT